jgi:DNA replication protein
MERLLINKLIEDGIIDFDKLIKKTYKDIGLKEVEAMFLMELHALSLKGIKTINPKIITNHLSLNEEEAINLLDSMMQRDYLSFDIKENKDGLTTESFSLDQTISKIITYYNQIIEEAIIHTEKPSDTDENEIAEILETQFQRQLKPLEVEVIIKWIKEYNYQKKDIKSAIIDAVKAGKTSISYIDGILLKKSKHKDEVVSKSNRKKSKILQDFLES